MPNMAVAPMTRGGEGYNVYSETDIMTMMTVMSVLVYDDDDDNSV